MLSETIFFAIISATQKFLRTSNLYEFIKSIQSPIQFRFVSKIISRLQKVNPTVLHSRSSIEVQWYIMYNHQNAVLYVSLHHNILPRFVSITQITNKSNTEINLIYSLREKYHILEQKFKKTLEI